MFYFDMFFNWFDLIPFYTVILCGLSLLVFEYLVLPLMNLRLKLNNAILINLWQVLGVAFPVMWLLRSAQSYGQVTIVVALIIFFGVYKPTTKEKKDKPLL